MNLRVGQKVIPIFDNWIFDPALGIEVPRRGQVYTIRDFSHAPIEPVPVGIRLVEIRNPESPIRYPGTSEIFERELAFDVSAFRPVLSTETGMEILRRLLVPSEECANV